VSNRQPNIDWQQVAASGIVGAYIEYGDGGWNSPTFTAQSQGAAAAGLSWGAYYFARPTSTDPIASADRFMAALTLATCRPSSTSRTPRPAARQASNWAQAFLIRCAQLGGRVPTIYTGLGYSVASDPASLNGRLWLAAYPWGYNYVPSVALAARAIGRPMGLVVGLAVHQRGPHPRHQRRRGRGRLRTSLVGALHRRGRQPHRRPS
jgi:GH25 family lysozyme M1 (1,4-beta-N-acetylmuramidase)